MIKKQQGTNKRILFYNKLPSSKNDLKTGNYKSNQDDAQKTVCEMTINLKENSSQLKTCKIKA